MSSRRFAAGFAFAAAFSNSSPDVLRAQQTRTAQGDAPDRPRDAADSSQLARLSYKAAGDRLRQGDTAAAVALLDSASRIWPPQPAYPLVLLELAARFRDTAMVRSALAHGANLHLGFAAAATPAVDVVATSTALRALLRTHATLSAPLARSRALHTLPDTALFPEGIAVDPRSGMLYIGSIHRRTVVSISASGAMQPFLHDTTVGAVFDVAVDTARNVVWATTKSHPSMSGWRADIPANAALIAISLRSGRIVRRIPFPASAPSTQPGDLAITAKGEVLVADAVQPVLWRLRPGSDSLEALTHHLFRSLQGIVPSADGRVAWVADYAHGLLRVSLDSGSVVRVADVPGQTAIGMDGMVRFGRSFVAVQNGVMPARIVQLDLDASGTRLTRFVVLDRNPLATSPTACTIVGTSLVYVANSLWELLDRNDAIRPDAVLPHPLLLRLPLGNP